MNHVPMKMTADSVAHPVRTTRRALAKQRTRETILAAARELFSERGYEGATIRDIARAAGMSTGAVFASFADKSELFDEILATDRRVIEVAMRQAAMAGATVDEALAGLVRTAYGYYVGQLQLTRSALAFSWARDPKAEERNREAVRPTLELVDEVLARGVVGGELSDKANLELVRDIVWQAYLSGYRAAAFDGSGAEELTVRFGEQLRVILAGVRA